MNSSAQQLRNILSCQFMGVLVVKTAACYGSHMSTLAEIEAALPMLSAEDLARVEAAVHRLQREGGAPVHQEDLMRDSMAGGGRTR